MTIANNSKIFNDVGSRFFQAVGNTGGIYIKAGSLSLNNATLSASTYRKGNAGGVFVQANNSVDIANSSLFSDVNPQAVGNTGGVNIKAGSVSLTNDALLSAKILGQGDTTGVFVQANNSVDIARSFIDTKAGVTGAGKAGDINILAGDISLTDGRLDTSTSGQGRAGDVMINARNTVSFDNSFIFSDTSGSGNGGTIDIKARELSLTNGAELLSRTTGGNKGGNIQINASESVSISGVNPDPDKGNLISGLITSSEGKATGQGGDITITTGSLRVSKGAVVSARTTSAGRGGNINVDTKTLELTGGGQVLASTFSSGSAGNITVNATDRISISGSDSTFNARVDRFGVRLIDNDSPNSGLFARVTGNATANAGNIEVTTRSINLDNQGTITTATTSGEGGDITLKARDIVLRNNSKITATAGTDKAGGNGGNIKIHTDVLVSAKNSDITANAFEGKGGNIRINTQGLFLSPDSDITASSQFGLDGVVEINTPDVDPTSGLVNLPEAPPADTRLAQGCQPGGSQHKNQFIITGRGGLPPSPLEMLTPDAVQVDLVTLKPEGENRKNANVTSTTTATPEPIVEATGWVVNAKGEVVLIAYAPTFTPHSSWQTSPKCDAK
jgi:large exoprotein involved in heme utilization and adhesion